MIVEIDIRIVPPRVTVADLEDFRKFAVRVTQPEHVWVAPDALITLAGDRAADPAWREGFEAMVRYAEAQGWVGCEGHIRAHIEKVATDGTSSDLA